MKALASQTGKATEEIGAQIQAIQQATKEAVDAIRAISATINEVNDISTTIAAAMEEQGATTAQMTRNTQEAAKGTQDVSASIANVSQETAAGNEPIRDACTRVFDEWRVTLGAVLTVRVAAVVVAVLQVLVNTAR